MKKIKNFFSLCFNKSLNYIETIGNKLPHPATLFVILALLVVVMSWVAHLLDIQAIHPVDSSVIKAKNLLSSVGIRWIYTNIIKNFLAFPPLGNVLVIMFGIGIAEGSGLITAAIRALVINSPKQFITSAIIIAGILSHLASDAGYVVVIPLGAMIFYVLGRHPIAGLAAAFAGVSGGFGANFLIGSVDPILAGISTSAAQLIKPDLVVNPVVNFYFMFSSSILIIIIGTWVTEKIIEPRLGKYTDAIENLTLEQLTPVEKKGLRLAGISLLFTIAILALTIIPEQGIFRHPETGAVLRSPFFDGIIIGVLIFFLIPGTIFGITVGKIKNDKDIIKFLTTTISGTAPYIVLVFFAAQFVYFFNYSNLGIILAIKGATSLKSLGLTGIPLVVAFVALSAFVNLFMGSASAKWAIMAPVFVPMFMLFDHPYHPALTQAAYRIGDSITNIITPMLPYFALIVTFAQKYDKKTGIGTLISTMLPYTLFFGLFWTLLLMVWMLLGIPIGPDGPLYMNSIASQ